LPIDTNTNANLGYAFVNFTSASERQRFQELSGQKLSKIFKQNMVIVDEASVQGIQANWDLYIRSAPINSSDPLRRPLFWPKTTLKGRSEAWDGGATSVVGSRRSERSFALKSGPSTQSADAMSNASSMPTPLISDKTPTTMEEVSQVLNTSEEEEECSKFPEVHVLPPPGLESEE
jgi:hypothetical protein